MTRKYNWDDGEIPTIDVHSTKKHDVLREYLQQYIFIVGGKPFQRKSLVLNLIDGFAGGGLYKYNGGIHYGSPLIFLKATEEAAFKLSTLKPFALYANYFFVEKEKLFLEFLKKTLQTKDIRQDLIKTYFYCMGYLRKRLIGF